MVGDASGRKAARSLAGICRLEDSGWESQGGGRGHSTRRGLVSGGGPLGFHARSCLVAGRRWAGEWYTRRFPQYRGSEFEFQSSGHDDRYAAASTPQPPLQLLPKQISCRRMTTCCFRSQVVSMVRRRATTRRDRREQIAWGTDRRRTDRFGTDRRTDRLEQIEAHPESQTKKKNAEAEETQHFLPSHGISLRPTTDRLEQIAELNRSLQIRREQIALGTDRREQIGWPRAGGTRKNAEQRTKIRQSFLLSYDISSRPSPQQIGWNRSVGTDRFEQIASNRSLGTDRLEQIAWNKSERTETDQRERNKKAARETTPTDPSIPPDCTTCT